MNNNKKYKVTKEVRKTTAKEKITGLIGWGLFIGLIIYLIARKGCKYDYQRKERNI